mgnify:FL=1
MYMMNDAKKLVYVLCILVAVAGQLGAQTSAPSDLPPATKVEAIERCVRLSPSEQRLFEMSLGQRDNLHMPVVLMFMSRLRVAPSLDSADWNQLDAPAAANLLRRPERYAGELMRITAHVLRVVEFAPNKRFVPSAYWPASNGPLWRYDCQTSDGAPITVFSHLAPINVLGEPSSRDEDGDGAYVNRPPVEFAGVFYKVHDGTTGDKTPCSFPVVLALQMREAPGAAKTAAADKSSQTIMIVIIALAGGFLIFRRQISLKKREDAQAAEESYRRTRLAAFDRPVTQEADADAEVDPDLRTAVEDFRRRKEGVDEVDGSN